MSGLFDLSSLLDNFNRLYKVTIDCLKFYHNPKNFLLEISTQKIDLFIKKLVISFIFIESLLVLMGSVLIRKFSFGLGMVPGLALVDCLYSTPLILIIFVSLRIAKISAPLKKSFAFVLFTKIFLGLPLQLPYFLFVSTEHYVFYFAFSIGIQLLILLFLFSAPFVYCKRIKQVLIVLSLTIILFVLYVFIISALADVGLYRIDGESIARKFDVIFSEYEELRGRAKIIDAIEFQSIRNKVDHFLSEKIQGDPIRNLEEFREDAKYYIGNYKEKIRAELEYFTDNNNYQFKSNKKRFTIYISLLNDLIYLAETYYEAADYYKLRIENIKLQQEMNEVNEALREYSDLGDYEKEKRLIREELIKKGLGGELLVLERVRRRQELQESFYKKEIQELDNETKVLKFLSNFAEIITKIQEQRISFADDELKYRDFILRWSFII